MEEKYFVNEKLFVLFYILGRIIGLFLMRCKKCRFQDYQHSNLNMKKIPTKCQDRLFLCKNAQADA